MEMATKYKKFIRIGLSIIVLVVAIILFTQSTFVVGENEQAVISQFGVIKRVVLAPGNTFVDDNPDLMNSQDANISGVSVTYGKGLYFRIPFIQKVDKYRSWLNTYISSSEQVNTLEKKQYYITMFAQWRIANPALFYITYKDIEKAEWQLDNLIYPAIVQNINRLTADEFISDKGALKKALDDALVTLNKNVRGGGIDIRDIQVHRTLLPQANLQSTYDRMIQNRAKAAQQLRSEGIEAYEKAVAEADREAREILSEAITKSERIKGEGDAKALEIYADAYGIDTEFYTYWRSLKALENSIGEGTTLVLDNNHPLWKNILDWVAYEQ